MLSFNYKSVLMLSLAIAFNSTMLSQSGCDRVPALNQKVIQFVKTNIGKKCGKGECWDLASEALNSVNANWDHDYKFGNEVKYGKECVYPGDIIQFEGVKLEYKKNGAMYKQTLGHHTAIIYEVKDQGNFMLAEQNTSYGGRKVSLHELDLSNITKGKYKIYRPVE